MTSRRARNKERARERVYTSAKTLFGRKGYADTSVAEIAEHADIARGTFFNYFPRKDALISVWAEERRTELMRRLSPQLQRGSGVVADLRACLAVLGALNEEEPELSVAMLTAWVQAGRPLEEESYLGAIFADIVEAAAPGARSPPRRTPDGSANSCATSTSARCTAGAGRIRPTGAATRSAPNCSRPSTC
ncbi:TetR/AcrR family transcriptional regulator [Kitasatospora arboriphila]